MTDLNAALFSKPRVHLSKREQLARQISKTERTLKACLDALKKSYDLLWQKQTEHDFLFDKMKKLEKESTPAAATERKGYEKELAQLQCDINHLKTNQAETRQQENIDRLQERLALLKAKEQASRESEPRVGFGLPSPSAAGA